MVAGDMAGRDAVNTGGKAVRSGNKATGAAKAGNRAVSHAGGMIKAGSRAVRNGGTAVKQGSAAIKTTQLVAKTAKQAKQSAQTAKQIAQRAAQAATQAAKSAGALSKQLTRMAKAAARLIISAFSGGLPVLLVILLIVAVISAIVASPLGIFFSGNNDGSSDVKPLSIIVSETNAELTAKIDQIIADNASVDEVRTIYNGSENNTAINNWCDVVSVFAVKTALADGDEAEDVVTLDNGREQKLKSVFWDMTVIEHTILTESRQPEDSGDSESEEADVTYRILQIIVDSKTAGEGAEMYGFSKAEKEVLAEMTSPENTRLMLELIGAPSMGSALTSDEIVQLREKLGGLTLDRQSLVTAALSLEGKVNYFWGGKSTAIGWDNRWGTPMEVTAPGSSSTGATRPFGLDCSGFVAWSFVQLGVSPDIIGWGTADQWSTSTSITWGQAQPGDLVFFDIPGTVKTNHVGIIAGFDGSGNPLVVHCNSSRNNVSLTEAHSTGFKYARRPVVFDS